MNHEAIETLSLIGLSRSEAIIYLGNLTLGPCSVLKIAQHTHIKRSSIYSVLNSLIEKGLINIQTNGAKKLYAAEPPEKIDLWLSEQKRKFDQILPTLKQLKNTTQDPESTLILYRGMAAVKSVITARLEELEASHRFSLLINHRAWGSFVAEHSTWLTNIAMKKNIHGRILIQTAEPHHSIEQFNLPLFQFRVFNSEQLIPWFLLTANKTLMSQTVHTWIAVSIEDPTFTQMHQLFFESLWEKSVQPIDLTNQALLKKEPTRVHGFNSLEIYP